MSTFIQLHLLTSYPASNLNRDDLGYPKSVVMGNTPRLRVSSQSLKRAWRTSDIFKEMLGGQAIGIRTREMGRAVFTALTRGVTLREAMGGAENGSLPVLREKDALAIARAVAGVFGKNKKETKLPKKDADAAERAAFAASLEIEQLAHFSREEVDAVAACVEECRERGIVPDADGLALLRRSASTVDIALFGRMLAASRQFNVEAAVQVAHAMTVHGVQRENDFFTAVDDLNREDAGAGHMGVGVFGAGLYYLYLCINRDLLLENLGGDGVLCEKALKALLRAAAEVSPGGKQNSFASRAFASFILAEKGEDQPRGLSVAFLDALRERDGLMDEAISRLTATRENMNHVYGMETDCRMLDAGKGQGSLDELAAFITA